MDAGHVPPLAQLPKDAVQQLSALLFLTDPMGINYESNTDEYDPEARSIVGRLHQAQSESEVLQIVHEEFVRWFDADLAGKREDYQGIATAIWDWWHS